MLSSPSNVRRAPLALGLSLVVAALAATATAADTAKAVTAMRVPGILSEATLVGRVPGTIVMNMSMSLAPASQSAFEAYSNAVSNPRSKLYHQFLTPAQIGTKFGASTSTVNQAVSFLKSKGMTVKMVADNHLVILFTGTAAKVESAFGIHLNDYSDPGRTNGPKKFPCYDTIPKVPASFASKVVSIGGLDGAYRPVRRSTLTPSLARTLYNSAALYGTGVKRNSVGRKGEGVNIGITNFDSFSLTDARQFVSTYLGNLTDPPIFTKVSVGGSNAEAYFPGLLGGGVEGNLDIQEVLANAPYSHVFIYDGSYTNFAFTFDQFFFDYVATLAQEAQDNLVDVVTESYGFYSGADVATYIQAAHNQHVAMSLQGITYLVASGDNGTDIGRFDYPDFDPECLLVGGTVATVNASGNRVSEVGWIGSGSGYVNTPYDFNVLPSYQTGPGVPTEINRRLFPDVAVHAAGSNDPNTDLFYEGFAIAYQGFFTGVSGTSGASPLLTGELGIILQDLGARGLADSAPNGRPRFGRLNDFIYQLGSSSSYSGAFLDITSGDSGPLLAPLSNGQTNAIAGPDWDFVTGWGAPDVQGFLNAYAATVNPNLPPTAANIYVVSVPTNTGPRPLPLGTNPSGAIPTVVTNTDGVSYTLGSVTQPGVGQVAAVTMDFTISTSAVNISLTSVLMSPGKTTEYVYLYNYTKTNADPSLNYDLVRTITGTGGMTPISVNVDPSPYISSTGQVRILARALKPSRFGNAPFTFSVDQATLRTRIAPQ